MVSVKMTLFKSLFSRKNKKEHKSLQKKKLINNEIYDQSNDEKSLELNRDYTKVDSIQKTDILMNQKTRIHQNEKINKRNICGIQKETLDKIIELAKKYHPKEFGAILFVLPEKGSDNEINEIREIKLGTKTQVKMNIPGVDIVNFNIGNQLITGRDLLNYSGVGIVHSHPDGILIPSKQDLDFYSKFGNTNIIIAHPYDTTSWSAFDQNGKEIYLDIVDDYQKKIPESNLINLTPLNSLLQNKYKWANTPIKFDKLKCIKIKKEYSTESKIAKIKSNNGNYVYYEEIAKEYYTSKGYNVITPKHIFDLYDIVGIGMSNETDNLGLIGPSNIYYFEKKASKNDRSIYLPISELQNKLANLMRIDILNFYKTIVHKNQIGYDNLRGLFDPTGYYQEKWNKIHQETEDFISNYVLKHPDCKAQLINIFLYFTYHRYSFLNYEIDASYSRIPQIILYRNNAMKLKFCKIYTHNVSTKRKQLVKVDRLFYWWNKEFEIFDYEVLMII